MANVSGQAAAGRIAVIIFVKCNAVDLSTKLLLRDCLLHSASGIRRNSARTELAEILNVCTC